jgi:predicted short-subunit dehydrogenase-like oxidoreductase (DUF2520 family)
MKFTKKDNLIIIGAGKLANSLAPALADAGYKISSIISSNIKDAEGLAKKLNIKSFSDSVNDLRIRRGVFMLAVPDDQIGIAADELSRVDIDFKKSLIIHFSGSHDISLLKKLSNRKAYTGSLHIMQTFPSKRRMSVKNAFSAIETNSDMVFDYLFSLSTELKLKPFRIDSGNKVIYHLAAVYASNFMNAVLFQSQQLFNNLKLKGYSFNEIFSPLYVSTVMNIRQSDSSKALSGPIERGDAETVRRHIKEIKRISGKNSITLISYLSLSLALINASEMKSGRSDNQHLEIRELLLKELSQFPFSKKKSIN